MGRTNQTQKVQINEEKWKKKRWFFENKDKFDKPLVGLIKRQRETTQVNEVKNEKGEVTTDTTEKPSVMR